MVHDLDPSFGSRCLPDRSQNVVDVFPCWNQSFCQALRKVASDVVMADTLIVSVTYLTVWEMLINLLKCPIPQWWQKWKSEPTNPTSQKNSSTFSGKPLPDTDFGSCFHFPHQRIQDFRRFISISHTVTSWFSRHSAKCLIPTR